ncbi:MAG: oligopeptide/dipeptide ABC transporter ATP-binding protein [Acidimicrobiales bacterium]
MSADTTLLSTVGLTKHFPVGSLWSRHRLHAVDEVDLVIHEHEIVALVGESGSGKSTIARLFAMLYRPTSGEIFFEGKPLSAVRSRRSQLAYRRKVPMVFQDPFSFSNPAYRISHGLLRAAKLHRPELDRGERRREAERVLDAVGLHPGREVIDRFPHELSGGQRQRVGFAEALISRPRLILADEPVSMLDVSIRISLLNLMADLRDREGVSVLYITHDIASAWYLADRVAVMYGGEIVEEGPSDAVLREARHPYTQLLLSAVPDPRVELTLGDEEVGEPPRVIDPGPGCRFRFRCPWAEPRCAAASPKLAPIGGPDHLAACFVAADSVGPLALAKDKSSMSPAGGETTPRAPEADKWEVGAPSRDGSVRLGSEAAS